MKAILRTDVGKTRTINEDAVFAGEGLYLVCDGMGGHQAGEIAAGMAVEVLSGALKKKRPGIRVLLSAVAEANARIFAHAGERTGLHGMGTTLTALWADERHVLIAQVGDSRAYLLRGGVLRQCTHDHSMVAELVRNGSITPEEARTHPQRNLITRTLGTQSKVDADVFEFARQQDDRWLLCSDGLTSMVSDAEIAAALSGAPLADAADRLLEQALARGGTDNITLVLLEDEGGASHD